MIRCAEVVVKRNKNIFSSSCEVITNPVNCVGVMGGGLALDFKLRFPTMFQEYVELCKNKLLIPGKPLFSKDPSKHILLFPTKNHYKDPSQFSWIREGLEYLFLKNRFPHHSIALPMLGCGLGGLRTEDVAPFVIDFFETKVKNPIFVELYYFCETEIIKESTEQEIKTKMEKILNEHNLSRR